MSQARLLASGWEVDFDREWSRLFRTDSPNSKIPRQKRASYPFKLEDVVRLAIGDLRKELGKAWLPNRIYGTRLHAAVRRRLEMVVAPAGWQIHSERPLRAIGRVSPALLQVTVGSYLAGAGKHLSPLRPQLSSLLSTKIGDIKPDLLIQGPDGVITIWDLTSREEQEHLAKTILYANLLTHDNQLAYIGETYWLKFR